MIKPEKVFGVRVVSRRTLMKLGFDFSRLRTEDDHLGVLVGSRMDEAIVNLVNSSREVKVREGEPVEDFLAPDDVVLGTMIGWYMYPDTDNEDTQAYYTDLITIPGSPSPFANLTRLNAELAQISPPPKGQTKPTVTGWVLLRKRLHFRLTYNVWYHK